MCLSNPAERGFANTICMEAESAFLPLDTCLVFIVYLSCNLLITN